MSALHCCHVQRAPRRFSVQEGLSLEEGKELIQRCINEVAIRFLVSQPKWQMAIVTADGVSMEVVQPKVDLSDKVPKGALGSVAVPGSSSGAAASAESKE